MIHEEAEVQKTARGSILHGCPFCAFTGSRPGYSHAVKNHAFKGRMKDGYLTKGCASYKIIEQLFAEKKLSLKKDTEYDIEPLTVNGIRINDSDRKNKFLQDVLDIARKHKFLNHSSINYLRQGYVRKPLKIILPKNPKVPPQK